MWSFTKPTMNDIYWAAGYLDGEGSFSRNKKHIGGQCVSMRSIDKEHAERLAMLFGGSVAARQYPNRKLLWEWRVSGARARGIMMTLYKLVCPRRQQQIRRSLQCCEDEWNAPFPLLASEQFTVRWKGTDQVDASWPEPRGGI